MPSHWGLGFQHMNLERKANIQSITSLRQEALGSCGCIVWSKLSLRFLVIPGSAAWGLLLNPILTPSLSLSRLILYLMFFRLYSGMGALPETPAGWLWLLISLPMLPVAINPTHSLLSLPLELLFMCYPLHSPSPLSTAPPPILGDNHYHHLWLDSNAKEEKSHQSAGTTHFQSAYERDNLYFI